MNCHFFQFTRIAHNRIGNHITAEKSCNFAKHSAFIQSSQCRLRPLRCLLFFNHKMMIGHRRNLLNYLQKKDINRYRSIIERLGLRK